MEEGENEKLDQKNSLIDWRGVSSDENISNHIVASPKLSIKNNNETQFAKQSSEKITTLGNVNEARAKLFVLDLIKISPLHFKALCLVFDRARVNIDISPEDLANMVAIAFDVLTTGFTNKDFLALGYQKNEKLNQKQSQLTWRSTDHFEEKRIAKKQKIDGTLSCK